MISISLIEKIKETAGRYPDKKSALLPALEMVQRANGNRLTRDDIAAAASLLDVSLGRAYGVATYYTLYNTSIVGTYHIQVDTNIPAAIAGAAELLSHLENILGIRVGETTPDGRFTLSEVEDLGSGGTCPVIQVNDTYYENMTIEKASLLIDSLKKGVVPRLETACNWGSECNMLLKNRGKQNSVSIAVYTQGGGYLALKAVMSGSPKEALDIVKKASIRGRGGAGFPAGMKWGLLSVESHKPVYLICNADEGEPGTFKDRQIMEYDPHLLLEGMAIAAYTIGARKAFIYIRGEYLWISHILEQAIKEAKDAGHLNHVDIIVHRGAGSYVCGDETALIESLEGKRGNPRRKPPYFPAAVGLYGCPTIVNNVETLACVPFVFQKGHDAFRQIGNADNAGPKIFGVSGHVNRPGVYEFPLGTPLSRILEAAGGVKGKLKGIIVGGLSVPILTAQEAVDLKMDYDSCLKKGTMLGSGGIIVINDTVSIPELALRTIKFYAHESCGQCTPCREGSIVIKNLVSGIIKGRGKNKDIDTILAICKSVIGLTLCPTGDAFAMPVKAMIEKYKSEFEVLIK